MEEKIRLAYLDEEEGWNAIAYSILGPDFNLYIPEQLPKDLEALWIELKKVGVQAVLVDYRLNASGKFYYNGDEVICEIHKHNKYFPAFIITSYEDNALIECKYAQIIRGKELLNATNKQKLQNIIKAGVNNYENRKLEAENIIKQLQYKINRGESLSNEEEANKFDAELYLSELDLDSKVRADMITNKANKTLDKMLTIAREITKKYQK